MWWDVVVLGVAVTATPGNDGGRLGRPAGIEIIMEIIISRLGRKNLANSRAGNGSWRAFHG